eukprot:6176837-Pleurochrysis_carterae.AAC.1
MRGRASSQSWRRTHIRANAGIEMLRGVERESACESAQARKEKTQKKRCNAHEKERRSTVGE